MPRDLSKFWRPEKRRDQVRGEIGKTNPCLGIPLDCLWVKLHCICPLPLLKAEKDLKMWKPIVFPSNQRILTGGRGELTIRCLSAFPARQSLGLCKPAPPPSSIHSPPGCDWWTGVGFSKMQERIERDWPWNVLPRLDFACSLEFCVQSLPSQKPPRRDQKCH